MKRRPALCTLVLSVVVSASAFQSPSPLQMGGRIKRARESAVFPLAAQRRDFLWGASIATLLSSVGVPLPSRAEDSDEATQIKDPAEGVLLYKTKSGLKYIQLEQSQTDRPTPRYGQFCVISYTAAMKLPTDKEKVQFDSDTDFLIKHGNGKMIPGLDEGLHTMKVGELRRIIIPPKLGFIDIGLGPLPSYPWQRLKLNKLLEKMIAQRGGNLVYDVRLLNVLDDEADQGYYEDDELSIEELEELQKRVAERAPKN